MASGLRISGLVLVGALLVLLGAAALAYQASVGFTSRSEEASTINHILIRQKHPIAMSPILSGLAVVAGITLVLTAGKRNP